MTIGKLDKNSKFTVGSTISVIEGVKDSKDKVLTLESLNKTIEAKQ